MANNNKKIKDNKPKFSPYWIYGILIAVFLGFQLFSSGNYQDGNVTTPSDFFKYLEEGDVDGLNDDEQKIQPVTLEWALCLY